MTVLLVILSAVTGYLLGSLNSSLIVGKLYRVDVRQHGSGNAGTTNTLRVLGKKAALFVLLGDVAKGIIAYGIGFILAGKVGAMAGGTAAILGHNWPVYFRFKGGKGALTSIAVVLIMDWRIGLIIVGVFAVLVAATRYVSLGSIIGAALFPVLSLVFHKNVEFTVFALVIGILAIVMHRSNIIRLIKGTESRIGEKKAVSG